MKKEGPQKIPFQRILDFFTTERSVWDVANHFNISYRDAWRYLDKLKWKNQLRCHRRLVQGNGYKVNMYIPKSMDPFLIEIPVNKVEESHTRKGNLPLLDLSLAGQLNAVLKSKKRGGK